MDIKKKVLFHFLFIVVVITGSSYIFLNRSTNTSPKSIKGIQTHVVSSTPTPTFSPTSAPTPTPTIKPVSHQTQPTRQAKQYGGWYWRTELNRAQVFIGTDSAGKDIWIDDFPAPTPTPTPKTAKSAQTSSGTSSIGNMTQTVQTKIIEKK